MSGHSKWSTIKHQKEATDVKKGAIFTKLSRAITVAVKQGGGDPNPESNFKLRLAVDKARAANMPKENINRAIDKATGGGGGESLDEITYEGYGPGAIGIIVEATTDNKLRTGQEIRNIFERAGGRLATPGSVAYNFTSLAELLVKTDKDKEQAMLELIDLGAQDIVPVNDGIEVFVQPQQATTLHQSLVSAGYQIIQSELISRPNSLIPISDPTKAGQIISLLGILEDHDDVQRVFTNADLPANLLVTHKT